MSPRYRRDYAEVRARFVYALIDPGYGHPFYVGVTLSPRDRFIRHLSPLGHGYMVCRMVQRIIATGREPEMVVLERIVGSEADGRTAHERWVSLLNQCHPDRILNFRGRNACYVLDREPEEWPNQDSRAVALI